MRDFLFYHSEAEYVLFGAFGTLTKNVKPVSFSISATDFSTGTAFEVFVTQ
jgi:hypothetical protein